MLVCTFDRGVWLEHSITNQTLLVVQQDAQSKDLESLLDVTDPCRQTIDVDRWD